MFASDKIRRSYRLLGHGSQGVNFVPLVMCVLAAVLCTSTIYCIAHELSNDEVDRIFLMMAAKSVNIMLSSSAASLYIMFTRNKINRLLGVMEQGTPVFQNEMPEGKQSFVQRCKANQLNNLNKLELLSYTWVASFVFVPAIAAIQSILRNELNIDVRQLPLPIPFYYPNNYDILAAYFVVYTCQSLYMCYIFGQGFFVFALLSSTFESVIADVNVLLIDVKYMDTMTLQCNSSRKLRQYTNYIIRCHQQIQGSVKCLSECISHHITMSNQCICFQLCAFLFCITEVDNKIEECCYVVFVLSISLILLVYCKRGQNMIDVSEEFRNALYNCPWLDKPQWFKAELQVMIANLSVPLQVKPHGLYVLDLNNFATVMNASYSFFNLLRTVKK